MAAVVDFDDWARTLQGLTSDKVALKAAIDRIDNSGGTDIGAGVSLGLQELAKSTDAARAQIMILLTDGVGAYDPLLTVQAGNAGVTIYTIALGTDTDESLLRTIATETGGTYTQVDDASDLPEVFREISDDNGDDGTDTDGDGLTDCEEERPMRDSAGYLTFTSDPRLFDTDGDGLSDGQEIGPSFNFDDLPEIFGIDLSELGDGKVYTVYSDPRMDDTDADGLSDAEEADFGSRARSGETDGDGFGDADEKEAGTDPTDTDTDNDGHSDGFEDANRDADFDPLVYTEEVSKWSYASDFALGAVCGELIGWCEKDSVAWLAGNISGGFFVVTDIRDAIGNLFSLDFVGAGVNLFGAIPLVGDAAGIVAKAREVRPPRVGEGRRDVADDDEDRPAAAVGQAAVPRRSHRRRPRRAPARRAQRQRGDQARRQGLGHEAARRRRAGCGADGLGHRLHQLAFRRDRPAGVDRRHQEGLPADPAAAGHGRLPLRGLLQRRHRCRGGGQDRLREAHAVRAAADRQGQAAARAGSCDQARMALVPELPVRDRRALARAARRAAQQGDRLHHPSTLIR